MGAALRVLLSGLADVFGGLLARLWWRPQPLARGQVWGCSKGNLYVLDVLPDGRVTVANKQLHYGETTPATISTQREVQAALRRGRFLLLSSDGVLASWP